MSAFIKPLEIHKRFGVKEIPGVRVLDIEKSHRKNKKYAITVEYHGQEHTVHFGHTGYEHYRDRSPIRAFSHRDHGDSDRRHDYLTRATAIRGADGHLTVNDPFSPNRYAVIVLW